MTMKQALRDKNHPDYKQGIRYYLDRVVKCQKCNRSTNLVYKTGHDYPHNLIIACSKECAESY